MNLATLTVILMMILPVTLNVSNPIEQRQVNITSPSSTIFWTGEKVSGSHDGHVKLKSGHVTIEQGELIKGLFEVDMNSLTCADLSESYGEKLVNHLKNEDFFDVKNHPLAVLEITQVRNSEQENINRQVSGTLTIKGITKPISFPAQIDIKDEAFDATAKLVVDRTSYDIRYGSDSFFDNLGDRAISDEFTLDIKIHQEL